MLFQQKANWDTDAAGGNSKRIIHRCVGCRKDSRVSGTPGAVGSTGFVCSCCGRPDPQISQTTNSPTERKQRTQIAAKAQLRYLPFTVASGQHFVVMHHKVRRSTSSPLFNRKTLDNELFKGLTLKSLPARSELNACGCLFVLHDFLEHNVGCVLEINPIVLTPPSSTSIIMLSVNVRALLTPPVGRVAACVSVCALSYHSFLPLFFVSLLKMQLYLSSSIHQLQLHKPTQSFCILLSSF